jgi:hypothetical protein
MFGNCASEKPSGYSSTSAQTASPKKSQLNEKGPRGRNAVIIVLKMVDMKKLDMLHAGKTA